MRRLRLIIIIICSFFLCACSSIQTTYQGPNGSVHKFTTKYNSLVYMKTSLIEIAIDNRGHMSGLALVLPVLLKKTPDITRFFPSKIVRRAATEETTTETIEGTTY